MKHIHARRACQALRQEQLTRKIRVENNKGTGVCVWGGGGGEKKKRTTRDGQSDRARRRRSKLAIENQKKKKGKN